MPRAPFASRRRTPPTDSADLERELLRKGVGALRAGGARCADCGRTPLVGERVHHYGERTRVCELCRALRPDAPERTELVRHGATSRTVRLVVRAA
jgi:hypothetical protein